MGGYYSGRRGGKRCTGELRQIDVRRLQREGYLNAGMSYCWQWTSAGEKVASIHLAVQTDSVRFTYRHANAGEQWHDVQSDAFLERTPCRYGGSRPWWRCPCCGKRVAILYIGKTPACRRCYGLAYRSERETLDKRATRQADKLRDRLGWEPGILNGNGPKPKGMHWRTFERLQARHDAYVAVSLAEMGRMLGIMESRLDKIRRR